MNQNKSLKWMFFFVAFSFSIGCSAPISKNALSGDSRLKITFANTQGFIYPVEQTDCFDSTSTITSGSVKFFNPVLNWSGTRNFELFIIRIEEPVNKVDIALGKEEIVALFGKSVFAGNTVTASSRCIGIGGLSTKTKPQTYEFTISFIGVEGDQTSITEPAANVTSFASISAIYK